jgi:hypothetical protein
MGTKDRSQLFFLRAKYHPVKILAWILIWILIWILAWIIKAWMNQPPGRSHAGCFIARSYH